MLGADMNDRGIVEIMCMLLFLLVTDMNDRGIFEIMGMLLESVEELEAKAEVESVTDAM